MKIVGLHEIKKNICVEANKNKWCLVILLPYMVVVSLLCHLKGLWRFSSIFGYSINLDLCLLSRYRIHSSLLISYKFYVYYWMHIEECSLFVWFKDLLIMIYFPSSKLLYFWPLIQAYSLDTIFIIECLWRNVLSLFSFRDLLDLDVSHLPK